MSHPLSTVYSRVPVQGKGAIRQPMEVGGFGGPQGQAEPAPPPKMIPSSLKVTKTNGILHNRSHQIHHQEVAFKHSIKCKHQW